MTREEQISQASYDWTGEYTNSEFHWGAEWADKHPNINFVSKLQSLIEEWSCNDSPEGKYRLEAYKELMEFVVND